MTPNWTSCSGRTPEHSAEQCDFVCAVNRRASSKSDDTHICSRLPHSHSCMEQTTFLQVIWQYGWSVERQVQFTCMFHIRKQNSACGWLYTRVRTLCFLPVKYFQGRIILVLILLGTIWLLFQVTQGQCQKLWLLTTARESNGSNVKLIFQAVCPSKSPPTHSHSLTVMDFEYEMTLPLVLTLNYISNTVISQL